jgi:TonB family protein
MTDELSIILSLAAVSPAPATILDTRPTLIVRCREGELNVYVNAGQVLEGDDDATPVRIRWGTDAPQEESWSRSTDYSAAFAPEPGDFLSQLIANPDVRIEVHPYDAVPVVFTFNARGLARYTPRLDAACPKKEKVDEIDTAMVFLAPSDQQVFMAFVVEERPEILSGPRLIYPDLLRAARIQGRVIVQAIVDTTGRAEPASVKVIQSPNPGFDQSAMDYVMKALFRPGRIHGRAVRVLLNLPIDFSIKP